MLKFLASSLALAALPLFAHAETYVPYDANYVLVSYDDCAVNNYPGSLSLKENSLTTADFLKQDMFPGVEIKKFKAKNENVSRYVVYSNDIKPNVYKVEVKMDDRADLTISVVVLDPNGQQVKNVDGMCSADYQSKGKAY